MRSAWTALTFCLAASFPVGGLAQQTTIAQPTGCVAGAPCSASQITLNGNSVLKSPTDGNILLQNNAGTAFSLLQFGGVTSSFPSWKRNGTEIDVRLADDSAGSSIGALNFVITNNGTVLNDTANGTLRVCNSAVSSCSSINASLIQIGGTTSSFPALKRSSTTVAVRLADDSADAALTSAGHTVSGAIINTGITSDGGHTDSTVCQDTTTHQFYSGSGTLGVCLGTSSARYKHAIQPLSAGLPDILKLKPVSYRLNADHGDPDKTLYGFTAEDMAVVLPQLVGLDGANKPNTADYVGLIPVLVRAVQQQQQEIADLKSRLAVLETANDNAHPLLAAGGPQ